MNFKEKVSKWFNLTTEDELEKIVAFWTIKHREAGDEIDRLRKETASLLAFDPAKVMTIATLPDGTKQLYLRGIPITAVEAKILKEEATYIEKTELWGVFQNTIADTARKVMFESAKDFDDMRTGKAMLRNLAVQKTIVKTLLEM